MIIDITAAKRNPNEVYGFDFDFQPEKELIANEYANFQGKAKFKGSYYYNNGCVYVAGDLFYSVKYPCDRCLKEVLFHDSIPFKEVFYGNSAEEDYYSYYGDTIDLTKPASDYIMLNIPSRILCSEECKGLCPVCGNNRNESECGCNIEEDEHNPFSKLKKFNE